jgi:tRNA G10  N-methylase Trm11
VIKSISYNEKEIISDILKMHCIGDIEFDPTYSKGYFYKTIKQPIFKMDINPQQRGIIKADAAHIPIVDCAFNTIMFDPPFLATTGKSLGANNNSNKINKRFTVFKNEKELHSFYNNSLIELHRVLKYNGILIFKCQDKVSSGIQYMSHVYIISCAQNIGFYCKDLFVLLAKNRIVADWQKKNQKHARKFHSYFLVLQKTEKKVKYDYMT